MKLDEFLEKRHEDDNLFFRLSVGEHQNLLDEALERIEELQKLNKKAYDIGYGAGYQDATNDILSTV